MQKRHNDNNLYFKELANTCKEYFIPYIEKFTGINKKNVLEIGCGMGGNLYPFYERNCTVTGIDIDSTRIDFANKIFSSFNKPHLKFEFRNENFFDTALQGSFDIIIIHDVIEHIEYKEIFFEKLKSFLSHTGIVYFGFPAWHMPFGGHQQLCVSKVCSKLPFIHLLPTFLYNKFLKIFKEPNHKIEELLDIKKCRMTVEKFEQLSTFNNYEIIDRSLWLINPHYRIKFNLTPIKVNRLFASIKYLRNYYVSSCFYLLQLNVCKEQFKTKN
ncbi:class I SAM-dependent methyltransferase [Haoranjiania flava]|uniref:Class I SAM-dependent methyltransferase n=1 Tax=Haoranjiania flava TaxID=1856322 RepID=A0AAE3ITI9_9BACT|nr:class I SAM-dependent methyltransferase [Haoranjiania flava]MCU7695537.1 class I SAM-dependent methyltransferase [Haoranjiania flava]